MVRQPKREPQTYGGHGQENSNNSNNKIRRKTRSSESARRENARREDTSSWQLVPMQKLPAFLKDNEYLLAHHRPQIPSITGCVRSAFRWHTDTINIWTHFIGCIGSLVLMIHHYMHTALDWEESVWHLPFFLGAVTCLGCSATYHTFLVYSPRVHDCLAKFDYVGVIVLIVCSFPPWLHLSFYCETHIRNAYLVAIYLVGFVCVGAILNDGLGKHHKHFRSVRSGLFMTLGLCALFPGMHFLWLRGASESWQHGSWLVVMAVWYLAGGVVYALRLPEKLRPGAFDILLHSHQFLHMFVNMGVLCCFFGIARLAEHRHQLGYYCPLVENDFS